MKTLGIIFLIVAFAATVSLVYYWEVIHEQLPPPPVKTVPENLTYKNEAYGFEVTYPRKYQLMKDSDRPHYFKTGGSVLATINLPQSTFPNTNFGSGEINFAVKTKSTEADCKTYFGPDSKMKTMTKTTPVGDETFYVDQFSGAAAGTKYDTTLLRIFHNTSCYEINETIGIANIGNYEPGAVSEVTVAEVKTKLDAVVNTFNFIKSATETTIDGPSGTLEGNIPQKTGDTHEFVQVLVYSSDRSQIVAKPSVSSSGDYSVNLPVGTYYVTYTSVYNTIQPPMKKVVITEDETVTINFASN